MFGGGWGHWVMCADKNSSSPNHLMLAVPPTVWVCCDTTALGLHLPLFVVTLTPHPPPHTLMSACAATGSAHQTLASVLTPVLPTHSHTSAAMQGPELKYQRDCLEHPQ